MRQLSAAQQLITRHRALLTALVLGIQLQRAVGVDVPVQRQRGKIALAVGMVDIGMDVFMGQVGADTHLLLAAEPATQISRQITAALIGGRYRHRVHIFRAFGHVVNKAARLGHATLQARQAFQHFDLLLVFQADVLLAGDGTAIDLVTAGRIQREAAHIKVFVITNRRIAFAHGGVIAQHFAEQARLLILDLLIGDHADCCGRVEQRRRVKAADRGGGGLITAVVLADYGYGIQLNAIG